MYENNIDNFNFKPLTLVNFFPKNKRSKNLNKDNTTNSNYYNHNLGYTNNAHGNMEKNNLPLPFLFQKYKNLGLYDPGSIDDNYSACCNSFSQQNLLPEDFKNILTKEMERLL